MRSETQTLQKIFGNVNSFPFKKNKCHSKISCEQDDQYKSYQNSDQVKTAWKVETDKQTGLSYFTPVNSSLIVESSSLSRKDSLISINFFRFNLTKNQKILKFCCCVPRKCLKSTDNDIYLVCQQYTSFPPFKNGESVILKSSNVSSRTE
ncbi:uncharacterized protein LOC111623593 [Centruroides sculpturatus]|uniref:uncharacterized protein LOC111623593 n=1 Tax=Centruroides sculpturatus TaxID=218467 RepID=UPI000C6D0BB9|nr:uncharacterized protein LOC111623593 [Centruroides sculpturatus]